MTKSCKMYKSNYVIQLGIPFYGINKNGKKDKYVVCECKCGTKAIMYYFGVRNGTIKSCGCKNIKASLTHGLSISPIKTRWKGMMSRCYNPNAIGYEYYGARGIKVCDRWKVFENFVQDMGNPPDGMTLDRIDVNGNYEPENVRWIDNTLQNRNTRANLFIEIDNTIKCLSEWCEVYNISVHKVKTRLYGGWPIKQALGLDPYDITTHDLDKKKVHSKKNMDCRRKKKENLAKNP